MIRFWNLLFAKTYVYSEGAKKYLGKGAIVATWHQNIFLFFGAKFHKGGGLASKSKDGDYMLKIAEKNKWAVFRGSSSKGGQEAVEKVISHFSKEPEMTFLITPDGPRGPRHTAKRGAFYISKKTGKPIIPMIPVVRKCWFVKSWDRFKIARPFQRCYYVFGDPIFVDREESDPSLKKYRQIYENQMQKIESYLE